MKAQRWSRGITVLSLTSALDGDGWSLPRPGYFTLREETRYPLYRRLGGPHGQCRQVLKISTPLGFDPRAVQPVASRYTKYAILAFWDTHSSGLLHFLNEPATVKGNTNDAMTRQKPRCAIRWWHWAIRPCQLECNRRDIGTDVLLTVVTVKK
jgi:hypothetical protein